MIIRFKVANYRAFRDEQELSFVATRLRESHDAPNVEGFSRSLLKIAAIYGANASGKTTVLRALQFFVMAVSQSHREWKPEAPILVDPFILDERDSAKPSKFEMDFLLQDVRYQFGFELDSSRVRREWLFSYPSGRRQLWYERREGLEAIKFGKKFSGENRAIQAMTRPNSLFLSAGAQNNHEQLLPIFRWITGTISFGFTRMDYFELSNVIAERLQNSTIRKRLSDLLRAADLGVIGLDVKEGKAPKAEIQAAIKTFMDTVAKIEGLPPANAPEAIGKTHELLLRHRSLDKAGVAMPLVRESAGTTAFLSLLVSAFQTLDSAGVLCIDELDSSLHPLLALELVRLFADPKTNPLRAQLIFNTHDVNLLDSSILRRDEIWFAEKDQDGSAHLYSLSDFRPRRNENLKRGYLQGRYGAVPVLSNFDLENPPE